MVGKWLVGLAWPAISRIMAALGLGTVTYIGLESALRSAITQAQSSLSGLAPDIMALLSMAGFVTALSVISGAAITSLAFVVLKRFSFRTGA